MMKRILKYTIEEVTFSLSLPIGSIIRHFDFQGNQLMLWVEVNVTNFYENRHFVVFTTGEEFENLPTLKYIGTTCHHKHYTVFHLYEKVD